MKKADFEHKVSCMHSIKVDRERFLEIIAKFNNRISGKKGAGEKRENFYNQLQRLIVKEEVLVNKTREEREFYFRAKEAIKLAEKAYVRNSEKEFKHHGYRTDYFTVYGIDYVGSWDFSNYAPYYDKSGEGIGLVVVEKTRTYGTLSNCFNSYSHTKYLVGKDNVGYYAYPVSLNCYSVEEALQWRWNGLEYNLIKQQGDIAIVKSNRKNKMPVLPSGYIIDGDYIIHATLPKLPLPKSDEKIIIAKRAVIKFDTAI